MFVLENNGRKGDFRETGLEYSILLVLAIILSCTYDYVYYLFLEIDISKIPTTLYDHYRSSLDCFPYLFEMLVIFLIAEPILNFKKILAKREKEGCWEYQQCVFEEKQKVKMKRSKFLICINYYIRNRPKKWKLFLKFCKKTKVIFLETVSKFFIIKNWRSIKKKNHRSTFSMSLYHVILWYIMIFLSSFLLIYLSHKRLYPHLQILLCSVIIVSSWKTFYWMIYEAYLKRSIFNQKQVNFFSNIITLIIFFAACGYWSAQMDAIKFVNYKYYPTSCTVYSNDNKELPIVILKIIEKGIICVSRETGLIEFYKWDDIKKISYKVPENEENKFDSPPEKVTSNNDSLTSPFSIQTVHAKHLWEIKYLHLFPLVFPKLEVELSIKTLWLFPELGKGKGFGRQWNPGFIPQIPSVYFMFD